MTADTTNRLSARSTLATAIIAAIALVVAMVQLSTSNDAQREATAQDTYKDYLKMAIENPELAEGFKELPSDAKLGAKYGWFVSYFLHSAEHVFLLNPKDAEWRLAIANQVCFHIAFLSTDDYKTNLQFHYNKDFRALVNESLVKCQK